VVVEDEAGNATFFDADTGSQATLPGAIVELTGEDGWNVLLEIDRWFRVGFVTGDAPLSIAILRGLSDNSPQRAVRFNDVSLPSGTAVELVFDADGGVAVRNDADKDGSFETTLTPTVDLVGAEAADITPPTVAINRAGGTISIEAADDQAGVAEIAYSLDGARFDTYSAPFDVTGSGADEVLAFADDRAGNRSALARLSLRPAGPAGSDFYTVAPCRVLDTRAGSALQGPGDAAHAARFEIAGHCDVPVEASAVALTVTVVAPTQTGYVAVYADGQAGASVADAIVSFAAGQTRANNAIVALGDGQVAVELSPSFSLDDGTHLVIDVVGYFREGEPQPPVE
jgi:hypothetical protein